MTWRNRLHRPDGGIEGDNLRRRRGTTARRRRTPSHLLLSAAALALAAIPGSAHAQEPGAAVADTATPVSCRGQIVSAIDVDPARPPFTGMSRLWRTVAHSVGLHHVTTRREVVAGLIQLEVGKPCTELRRAESERVLRAQPFLASAEVRAFDDSSGGVRIAVTTVDEIPVIVNARVSHASPEALTLGNGNVQGRGISAEIRGERGHAYRDGAGVRVTDYALLGGPYVATLDAERRPLGSLIGLALGHPFYTDLQSTAWRLSFREDYGYRGIVRPAGDPLAIAVRQTRWEAGGLHRRSFFGRTGAVGAVLIGVRDTPANQGVVISDSGLAPDTGLTLRGRYTPFRVVRPAGLIAMRLIHVRTVRGLNSLTAREDLASGVQAGVLVGRGISAWGASDLYLAGTMYAGHAGAKSLAAAQIEVEGLRDYALGNWGGLIASGRLAWYRKRAERQTFIVSEELSGGSRARLPLQLTFAERRGGLHGYRGSLLGGAWRSVTRVENRWVLASPFRHADVGFAGFADAGTLWAGTAPYGRDVALRGSAGVSVLAAIPSGSRRVMRLDLAVPTTRDGNKRWELRFSSDDLTRRFWREPADVSRARTGPVPSSLFVWPVR